jgi:hypothetical protein
MAAAPARGGTGCGGRPAGWALLAVPFYGQPELHCGRLVGRQKPHNENDIDRIRSRTPEMPAARPPVHAIARRPGRREIAVMGLPGLIDGSSNPLIHMLQ